MRREYAGQVGISGRAYLIALICQVRNVYGMDHLDVVGAKLILEAGGRKQTRFAQGGGSYASSSDRRHVFGVGTANHIDKATVIWPKGKEQSFSDLKYDRYYRLTEGSDKA